MRKIILILTMIVLVSQSTMVFAMDSCSFNHRDGGGNGGNHARGITCTHSIGIGYWDYTCEHVDPDVNGYHSLNCSEPNCSINRPENGLSPHDTNDACPNCGIANMKCSLCTHIKYHDCNIPGYALVGNNVVGSTLTVTDDLDPTNFTKEYQWYTNTTNSINNGNEISGATNNTLVLTPEMYGKYIYVRTKFDVTEYNVFDQSLITTAANNGSDRTTESVKPTVSFTGDTTYRKSQTATIELSDLGGSHLKSGTHRIEYEWTTSATTPTIYSESKNITIPANQDNYNFTITKNTGTGIFYLHVKLPNSLTDGAGNSFVNETMNAIFYLDNSAPTIDIISTVNTYTAINKNNEATFEITVTDMQAGFVANEFTINDIKLLVGERESKATKVLTYRSFVNNEHKYQLKISNVTETGKLSFKIVEGGLRDNIGNQNPEIVINNAIVNTFADNIAPTIAFGGGITVEEITEGKNYNNLINPRYINKEYKISIPIRVTDISDKDLKNALEVNDIRVLVNNKQVIPELKELRLINQQIQNDATTGLDNYIKNYTLELKGLTTDGYLSLVIADGALVDSANNTISEKTMKPYTTEAGTNYEIFVDNTKPRISIKEVVPNKIITKNQTAKLVLYIREEGAGITSNQFEIDDVNVQVNGITIATATKQLNSDAGNNFNTQLGNYVATNYMYDLDISNVTSSGGLRIEIPANRIVDKANNGIDLITLSAEIKVDNEGPKTGTITSNADSHGEVIGKPVVISIKDCFDINGIEKYVWQRSENGINWEEIEIKATSHTESSCMKEYEEDNNYYYRVVVYDTLGNTGTSDMIKAGYRASVKGKPTIRLSQTLNEADKVTITAVIKSLGKIESVKVNQNEIPKESYIGSVTQSNYEYTTIVTYIALSNSVYEFEVTDNQKNVVIEKINVNVLGKTSPLIKVEKYDATILSNAKIIFTSDQPIKIVDPNLPEYTGIVFHNTSFSTRIETTLEPNVRFNEDKIFVFESKGLERVNVVVKSPIITKYAFVRFSSTVVSELNKTIKEIDAYVKNIPLAKKTNGYGMIKSYYGFNQESQAIDIATKDAIDAAKLLGNATETFVISSNKQKVEMKKVISRKPDVNAGYVNGNITGMYQVTTNLLSTFNGIVDDSPDRYGTFRVTIKP